MQRFYIPVLDANQKEVRLADSRLVHQCGKVLRMKPGSQFTLFDAAGNEAEYELKSVSKKDLEARRVKELGPSEAEPAIEVHLWQGIPKKPATFEWIVQKATELGVSHIHPLITRRTETEFPGKPTRLEVIAMEAAEQCGRRSLPVIHKPAKLAQALLSVAPAISAPAAATWIAYEAHEGDPFSKSLPKMRSQSPLHLFIGPEGGFAEDEMETAKKTGASLFSLGPRILRTETAAVAVLAGVLTA
jgi:16S rRNA (uracil1498-N3)-methyltransferase